MVVVWRKRRGRKRRKRREEEEEEESGEGRKDKEDRTTSRVLGLYWCQVCMTVDRSLEGSAWQA